MSVDSSFHKANAVLTHFIEILFEHSVYSDFYLYALALEKAVDISSDKMEPHSCPWHLEAGKDCPCLHLAIG
jgi:hypothetical protein